MPEIHPDVEALLKFDTIENLYTPEITVSSKIPHGCVDMRNVMSKPFCIENLCWAPNIKGQHSTKHVKDIIEGLKEVKERGLSYTKTRKTLIETLSMYKESASSFGQ